MSYLDDVARRMDDGDAQILVHELSEALAERVAAGAERSPELAVLHELVRFCLAPEIRPWLLDECQALGRVRRFAERHGLDRLASILEDSLQGRVQEPCAAIITGHGYVAVPIDASPPHDACCVRATEPGWDATDIAIAIELDALCRAVVREFADLRATVELAAPARLRRRADVDRAVADRLGAGADAPSLFSRLLRGRNARIAAGAWNDREARNVDRAQWLATRHVANPPASAETLARIRARYGNAVDELLSVYALHDGAELFVVDDAAGFVLAPIAQWDAATDEAIAWLTPQFHDPADFPGWLPTCIAFAHIPGDADALLLVTAGLHAGKIMPTDSDACIDDAPLFESLAQMFGVLLADAPRIIGRGGYVSYRDGAIHPIAYTAD